jgi:glucose uptake protein GlcU
MDQRINIQKPVQKPYFYNENIATKQLLEKNIKQHENLTIRASTLAALVFAISIHTEKIISFDTKIIGIISSAVAIYGIIIQFRTNRKLIDINHTININNLNNEKLVE